MPPPRHGEASIRELTMTTEEAREAGENNQWRKSGFSRSDDWVGSGEARPPQWREPASAGERLGRGAGEVLLPCLYGYPGGMGTVPPPSRVPRVQGTLGTPSSYTRTPPAEYTRASSARVRNGLLGSGRPASSGPTHGASPSRRCGSRIFGRSGPVTRIDPGRSGVSVG